MTMSPNVTLAMKATSPVPKATNANLIALLLPLLLMTENVAVMLLKDSFLAAKPVADVKMAKIGMLKMVALNRLFVNHLLNQLMMENVAVMLLKDSFLAAKLAANVKMPHIKCKKAKTGMNVCQTHSNTTTIYRSKPFWY